jgi:hypothetical protein
MIAVPDVTALKPHPARPSAERLLSRRWDDQEPGEAAQALASTVAATIVTGRCL